ncbi:hypothetical protein [Nostoc sp.]|uniref:hypothetical protein n=1 Tax=Nostoc sp. TaxID=1180 RepID=UPI002FFA2C50
MTNNLNEFEPRLSKIPMARIIPPMICKFLAYCLRLTRLSLVDLLLSLKKIITTRFPISGKKIVIDVSKLKNIKGNSQPNREICL